MKIFLKYLFIALSLFLSVQINACGIGNLSQLSKIPSAYRTVKSVIAGVELASASTDFIINHTEVCEQDQELCNQIRKLTFAINIATLSADIYSASQIKKLAKETAENANSKNIAIPESTANNIEDLGGVPVVNKLANAGGKLYKSIDEAVLTHVDDITSKLYRGDTRGVDDIFENGFKAKGNNTDLFDYVEANTPSIFIGTTKQPSVATSKFLKDKDGYVLLLIKKGL